MSPPAINRLEDLSLAILFGAALVSLASFMFGFLLSGVALRGVVAGVCLAVGGVGVWRRWRARNPFVLASRGRLGTVALLTLLLGQAWLVTNASLRQGLGWDGLFVWNSKALRVVGPM